MILYAIRKTHTRTEKNQKKIFVADISFLTVHILHQQVFGLVWAPLTTYFSINSTENQQKESFYCTSKKWVVKHVANCFQKLVKIMQKPTIMLALSSQLLFSIRFGTYRLRIKREVMQKSDKKLAKTKLKLKVIYNWSNMHFTKKISFQVSKTTFKKLSKKSDFHISICQNQFKRHTSIWDTL